MSWRKFVLLLHELVGTDAATRIERRANADMSGQRVTVPQPHRTGPLTAAQVDNALAACGGSIDRAAKRLGVHHTTVYRHLNNRLEARQAQQQQPDPPGPRIGNRMVR